MVANVEKQVPGTPVYDEDGNNKFKDSTATENDEIEKASKKVAKGKATNSRSEDFRLRQLDFESGNTNYRRNWWQLWFELLHERKTLFLTS